VIRCEGDAGVVIDGYVDVLTVGAGRIPTGVAAHPAVGPALPTPGEHLPDERPWRGMRAASGAGAAVLQARGSQPFFRHAFHKEGSAVDGQSGIFMTVHSGS
jgi:hypothetical protein